MTLPHKLTLSHIYSEMQSSVLILQEKKPLLYKQPTLTFSAESKISCFFFFFSFSFSLQMGTFDGQEVLLKGLSVNPLFCSVTK